MLRCPNCKTKVARFPLKDNNGKLIVRNLFKMDLTSIMWFAVIILLVTTYKSDIETCEYIVTHPLTYCEDSNACKIIAERKLANPLGIISIDDIPDFNNTKW